MIASTVLSFLIIMCVLVANCLMSGSVRFGCTCSTSLKLWENSSLTRRESHTRFHMIQVINDTVWKFWFLYCVLVYHMEYDFALSCYWWLVRNRKLFQHWGMNYLVEQCCKLESFWAAAAEGFFTHLVNIAGSLVAAVAYSMSCEQSSIHFNSFSIPSYSTVIWIPCVCQ